MHPSRSSIFKVPAITNASDLGSMLISLFILYQSFHQLVFTGGDTDIMMAGGLTTPTPTPSTSMTISEPILTGTENIATTSASDTWDHVTLAGGQKGTYSLNLLIFIVEIIPNIPGPLQRSTKKN